MNLSKPTGSLVSNTITLTSALTGYQSTVRCTTVRGLRRALAGFSCHVSRNALLLAGAFESADGALLLDAHGAQVACLSAGPLVVVEWRKDMKTKRARSNN